MVGAVICGMEHSGTTLVSDLLRQTGTFESGFEVGVLMGSSPREFQSVEPYYENMTVGWEIGSSQLEHCCDTGSFDEFYSRLKSASGLIGDDQIVFDKTPRYVAEIERISQRTTAPIIVIHKDPRASVYSDYKRAAPDEFTKWFDDYAPKKLRYMRRCYEGYEQGKKLGSRFLSFALEDLCFDAISTSKKLYNHVGQEFRIEYLLMDKLRYKNTRAKFVSTEVLLEYVRGFSEAERDVIEKRFLEFDDWFFRYN